MLLPLTDSYLQGLAVIFFRAAEPHPSRLEVSRFEDAGVFSDARANIIVAQSRHSWVPLFFFGPSFLFFAPPSSCPVPGFIQTFLIFSRLPRTAWMGI